MKYDGFCCGKNVKLQLYTISSNRLAAKFVSLNDRIILGVTFILALAGVILFGDWQGIGQDPCSSANIINHFYTSTNNSLYDQSEMFSANSVLNRGGYGDSISSREDNLFFLAPLPDETNSSNSSIHSQWVERVVRL